MNRQAIVELLNELLDWETQIGGFDAPIWRKVHAYRDYLVEDHAGVFKATDDIDGTSGQDRENYSDSQDRDSYSTE